MQKKITKLALIFSLLFSFHSVFALEVIDLATMDKEKIEGSIEDNFGMPDYDAELAALNGENELLEAPAPVFEPKPEPVSFDAGNNATNNSFSTEIGGTESASQLVITKEGMSSSAPLAQSGPGVVISLLVAVAMGLAFFSKVRTV